MTDLNAPLARGGKPAEAKHGAGSPAGKGASVSETKLHEFAELLFFAYRDFTRDPDTILSDFGFGRAHHRVLHFVNRHAGLRVADLPRTRRRAPHLTPGGRADVPVSLEAYERCALERALSGCGGDVAAAARCLGVGRSTFYRKLAKHDLGPRGSGGGSAGSIG